MVEYNKYPEYKDSGVQWLGEIPADWNARKVENAATFFTGGTPPTTNQGYFDGDNIWVNISDLNNEEIYDSKKHISDSGVKAANIVISPKGSLLFSFKLSVGKVAIAGKDLYTNEAIATFVPKDTLDTKFAFYSFPYTLIKAAKKNIYNANLLNAAMIREAKFPLPPLETQNQIVAFLDTETKKIDGSVSAMESLISLLTEKRSALISETVTRGVPGDHTEFKDSGVAWLGEIPADWNVLDPKNAFSSKAETPADDDVHLMASQKYGVIPQKEYLENTGKRVVEVFSSEARFKHIDVDDFLIHLRSFQGGIEHCINKGKVTAAYTVVNPKLDVIVPLYAKYLLKSKYYIGGIASTTNQLRDGQSIKWKDFRKILLPIPSIEEQIKIAKYIAKEALKIDTLINEAHQSIRLLQEKRQTLISDTVTGKINPESK